MIDHLLAITSLNVAEANPQMTIKMNHCHRSVCLVDAPQQGESNGVVTAHGNDARQRLTSTREPQLVSVCEWLAHENAVVSLLDLLNSPGVIVRRHGDIATVHDTELASERVRLERDVVAATRLSLFQPKHPGNFLPAGLHHVLEIETPGTLSDTAWAESRSRSVRGAGVEGGTCSWVSISA